MDNSVTEDIDQIIRELTLGFIKDQDSSDRSSLNTGINKQTNRRLSV